MRGRHRSGFRTGHDHDLRLFPDAATALRYGLLLAAALLLPLLLDDFLLGEVTLLLIWAVAGMGLMLLTGQAGQVSLGHAAFLALGCYTHAILMLRFEAPFVVAFLLAGLVTGLVGVLVAIPVVRLHGIYLAIATLALSMLSEDAIVLLSPWTGGVGGLVAPEITIAGLRIDRFATPDRFYWLCLAVAVAVTLGYRNLLRAPLGRAFGAIRDSELSARAMGVDPARTKMAAFGLSCAVTGWAGALMGHFFQAFNHEAFTLVISIQLLLMIVIGGLGSLSGAWYGAAVLALIPPGISLARDAAAAQFGLAAIPGLETGLFALLLVLILRFEPHGIHGRIRRWQAWWRAFPLARRDMLRRQRRFLRTERFR